MNTATPTRGVRYLCDEQGNRTDAVVPIELWEARSNNGAAPAEPPSEPVSDDDPDDPYYNEAMMRRLKAAMETPKDQLIPLSEALARLGISEDELR